MDQTEQTEPCKLSTRDIPWKTFIVEARLNLDVMVCAPDKKTAMLWANNHNNKRTFIRDGDVSPYNLEIESVYETIPRPPADENDDDYGGIYFIGENAKELEHSVVEEILEIGKAAKHGA